MKKKIDITIKCNNAESFNQFFAPDYNKIVGIDNKKFSFIYLVWIKTKCNFLIFNYLYKNKLLMFMINFGDLVKLLIQWLKDLWTPELIILNVILSVSKKLWQGIILQNIILLQNLNILSLM